MVFGGGYFEGTDDGYFHRPTILANVTESTPAVREELFGPVLTVQTFREKMRASRSPGTRLTGYVPAFTRATSGKRWAMRRIAAGTVWINRYGRSGDMIIPTGGFKQSGIGKISVVRPWKPACVSRAC